MRQLDDRIHKRLMGRAVDEMPAAYRAVHDQVSLLELAAKIRSEQKQSKPLNSNNSNNTESADDSNAGGLANADTPAAQSSPSST